LHLKETDVKTYSAKQSDVQQDWYVIDATGKTLGHLAVHIAHMLRGKHKPIYTPHVDTGDFIVVTNAEKIHLSGLKREKKLYYRHSGYPGGIKSVTADTLFRKKPADVLHNAVRGMLPKNSLGRQMLKKLKIYIGGTHPHQAQQPITLEVKGQ
jgi:large subunit ribosomal protein L13